jgi:hypothetical protein
MLLTFDRSLVDYEFEANIYEVDEITNQQVVGGDTVTDFVVTEVDLANGKIDLSLTETQTLSLDQLKMYRWYLRWVRTPDIVTRTPISGTVTPVDP